MNWIARNLISRERCLMLRTNKLLWGRPRPLEYRVQLWNPASEHGNWYFIIVKIEGVQRRAYTHDRCGWGRPAASLFWTTGHFEAENTFWLWATFEGSWVTWLTFINRVYQIVMVYSDLVDLNEYAKSLYSRN